MKLIKFRDILNKIIEKYSQEEYVDISEVDIEIYSEHEDKAHDKFIIEEDYIITDDVLYLTINNKISIRK